MIICLDEIRNVVLEEIAGQAGTNLKFEISDFRKRKSDKSDCSDKSDETDLKFENLKVDFGNS